MVGLPPYLWGPSLDVLPQLSPPTRMTPIGDPTNEAIDIYLGSAPMSAIAQMLNKDLTVIGLLLGQAGQHDGRPLIIVTDCIFSPLSASETQTHFDDDALTAAHEAWQRDHPDTMVVGWFYGSPNRSSTLLTEDRLTHERLFAQRWQIGLLIDSAQNTSVVIRWDEDEIVLSDQYYYWDMSAHESWVAGMTVNEMDEGAHLQNDPWIDDEWVRDVQPAPRRRPVIWPWVALAFVVIMIISSFFGGFKWTHRTLAQHADDLNHLKDELNRLENESALLAQMTVETEIEVREQIRRTYAQEAEAQTPPQSPPQPQILSRDAQADAPSAVTTPPRATSAAVLSVNESNVLRDVTYVIQPGDTMWKISESLTGNPHEYRSLAQSNDIGNPDLIFPGQRLVVPGLNQTDE